MDTNTLSGRMIAYIKAPFTGDPQPMDWLWFTIFVWLVAFMWYHVLRHITEG